MMHGQEVVDRDNKSQPRNNHYFDQLPGWGSKDRLKAFCDA